MVLTLDVNAEISAALRGAGAASASPSASSAKMRVVGARICCWMRGEGARKAVAVDATKARVKAAEVFMVAGGWSVVGICEHLSEGKNRGGWRPGVLPTTS